MATSVTGDSEPSDSPTKNLVLSFLILKSYKQEMFTFLTDNIFSKHCALCRYDTRLRFHRTKIWLNFCAFYPSAYGSVVLRWIIGKKILSSVRTGSESRPAARFYLKLLKIWVSLPDNLVRSFIYFFLILNIYTNYYRTGFL